MPPILDVCRFQSSKLWLSLLCGGLYCLQSAGLAIFMAGFFNGLGLGFLTLLKRSLSGGLMLTVAAGAMALEDACAGAGFAVAAAGFGCDAI